MNKELKAIKKDILRMAHYSHASHIGAALSVVDMIYVLYSRVANILPMESAFDKRDKFILSKAHASSAFYSVLAHLNFIPKEWLNRYYIDGGILPAHLDRTISPFVDISAGSLGHGLSVGIGMAIADKKHNVYVFLGDGECNEGSVWEALMSAGQLKLKNLVIGIDFNGLQAFGYGKDILDQSNLSERLKSFGLDAFDCDGHDLDAIEQALKKTSDRTKAIVFHTVKGHGVSFMENSLLWHYRSPNDDQLTQALKEIDNA